MAVRSGNLPLRVLLLLGLLFALLPAARAAETPASPSNLTKLRVATDNNYPPFMFVDGEGNLQGYEADMWKLYEKHTGIKVELIKSNWADAQAMVLAGKADVIDLMYRTPEREKLYTFSKPYATLPVGIFVNRDLPGVRNLDSMRGLPVGVEEGDACAEKLTSLGVSNLVKFRTYDDVARAAIDGKVRIFCMDRNPAEFYLYRANALDRFQMAFTLYEGQLHRAALKHNAALLATVEQGMAKIPLAEREALDKKWLEHSFVLSSWLRTASIAAGAALGIVALLTLWLWLLGRSVRARTKELSLEKNKLRSLLNASPDAIWMKDRNGVYIEGNQRVLDTLGLPQRPLIGLTDFDLFPPETAHLLQQQDQEVMQTGKQEVSQLTHQTPQGERSHETIKAPVFSADGEVVGTIGAARDITERLQSEAQLRLWADAFQNAAFGMVIFDTPKHCIAMANPTFAQERGYTPEEMVGMHVDCLYPADLVEERRKVREDIDKQVHTLLETEHITRDGKRFPVQLDISNSTDDNTGRPRFTIVHAQNISHRLEAERELRLAAVAFQTQEAMMVLDTQGHIQRINQAFSQLTGYSADEIIGNKPSMLESQSGERDFYKRVWSQVQTDHAWLGEIWISDKHRQLKLIRAEISPVTGADQQIAHYVCAMSDLTGEHEAHARAEHMAYFDPLTDLPNRNYLIEKLQSLLSDTSFTTGVLLLFDVDHFKRVNDLRGHAVGDRLLAYIAQRLNSLIGETDVLSRFNGGTFALLLTCKDPSPIPPCEHAPQFAQHLQRILRDPFWMGNGAPISISVSIGWTELHPGEGAAEAALKEAELAMYAAKSAGRDTIQAFEPDMLATLEQRESLADELLNAIACTDSDAGLELHMQLQVDHRGAALGAEALLRFTRPSGERVPPDKFIPLAEDNGMILPLGDWVLQRACERLAVWAKHPHLRDLVLAINVSPKQFAQPSFVEDVRQALARTGASPNRLKLEITESMILGNVDEIVARLAQLRAMGITISIDDFGTGYSSLAYLSRLPLDQLKIDRSFVTRLPEDSSDATVAQTVIGMGRGLGLEVIAEGVETEAQRDFLTLHGCHAFQGYLFSRPLPLMEFEALMTEQVGMH